MLDLISEGRDSVRGQPPQVWVLTTKKLGDNAQVQALAEALGWPYEIKRLEFTGLNHFHFRVFGPSLHKVDLAHSTPLVPPWPDLVLTIGRRTTPVALWIRDQSGGKTRLVQVGQLRIGFNCFDLVIANPQHHLPARPHVLRLYLPLLYSNTTAITAAAAEWRPHFASLPRPWTALLVGGSTASFVLNARVARTLMEEVKQGVMRAGSSLIVTTSRRTSPAAADVIEAMMPPSSFFHRWAASGQSNPYLALLGLADRFIVTGDSISMLVEVARQRKPLAIYSLPSRMTSVRLWVRRFLQALLFPPTGTDGGVADSWRTELGNRLVRWGLLEYHRDFSLFHRLLIERRLAVRWGDPFLPIQELPPDELPQVVERVAALFQYDAATLNREIR